MKVYTHMGFPQPPSGPETISKSGFKQRPSDWTRPLLRVLGKGHNSRQHLPSQGKGLGEPTLAPHLHTSNGDLTSQREALMTWGGGLCDSGPGRGFRLLLSTLRAPGRQRPVLPTHSTRGGAHRGQGCWELSGCSVLIRGDRQVLHSLVLVSLRGRDIPQFS